MFFVTCFILSWLIWFICADKNRWREILPVSFFAGFLGSTTDTITAFLSLWEYKENGKEALIYYLLDDFGIYIVIVYLFIQWLPENKSLWSIIRYFFYWTTISITIEIIFLITNHIEHIRWNIWYSYVADWFLFWLFYQYHKSFRLKKLNQE
ncbi:CBO0543 family protein [Ammoniphilus resinae]|uniref:Rod shape-determining protein MreD n=1 Tax=Ammoniphilus resinae TaxID=861532 RepID=A0ABS4GWT8_9BACL|nr:hypothetical protein [Ammoniphilus resinae]